MQRTSWIVLVSLIFITTTLFCLSIMETHLVRAAPALQHSSANTRVVYAPLIAKPNLLPQLPTQMTNVDGSQVTVTSIDRIVSLNGDITEIIFALELGDQVVAVDTSATYPPEATALPNVGYQRDLNAEGILSFNPTLIIGKETAGPPPVIAQLQQSNIPMVIQPSPFGLDSPAAKIRYVAAALGVYQRGEALVWRYERDLAAAQAAASQITTPAPRAMFLYLRGTDIQLVGGSLGPSHAMIEGAAALDVGAQMEIEPSTFWPINAESIVAAQPEVFVVTTTGLASVGGVDGLLQIPGLADTPAAQNRRVVALEDEYLLGMGPRTGQALLELVTLIHE